MKELKMKEPIKIELEQFECPVCKKKIYINKEDITEEVGCAFCDIPNIKNTRLFRIEIHEIFEKE